MALDGQEITVVAASADLVPPVDTDTSFDNYYGDITDDDNGSALTKAAVFEEVEHADSKESDTPVGDVSTDEGEEDDYFGFDDIDLSHIDKSLRRETLLDTIKAIDEDRVAKQTLVDNTQRDLANVKQLLQEDTGEKDSYVAQYKKNLIGVEKAVDSKKDEAFAAFQAQVDANEMTEAEANYRYGQYCKELDGFQEQYKTEAYSKTNLAIVENFITANEEILKNPAISKAAEALLTDIITDGNIVDTERSMQYLQYGKSIYDEGYKSGLAAAQQDKANNKNEDLKKKLTNPQARKGAGSPKTGSFPYTSAAEVPDNIWNDPKNEELREYFKSREKF